MNQFFVNCRVFLYLSMALLMGSPLVSAQSGAPFMWGPGEYRFVEPAQIEKFRIDWSKLVEQQDHATYERIVGEAADSYRELYNELMRLNQMHIDSVIAKSRVIPASELAAAQLAFRQKRDVFQSRLSAVAVLGDVWRGLGQMQPADAKEKQATEFVYNKGALNLKAFTDVYRTEIDKLVAAASQLSFRYDNNTTVIETERGLGLEELSTTETPDSLGLRLSTYQQRAQLTREDVDQGLARMSLEVGRHMALFINANNLRLYWLNQLQVSDRDSWVQSLENKARVMKFAKAVYCMPTSVPALDIPRPKKLNRGYLERGAGRVRVVQKAETDEAAIRSTLTRFDEAFRSVQSQAGEFNKTGGVAGFIHRVNSKLTWQNEVAAYLSVMNILRDMFQDELDLLSDPVLGCEKVRERYYERFGSLRDPGFQKTASAFLEGTYMSADPGLAAFQAAGRVILTKGSYLKDLQRFLSEHPAASLVVRSIHDDPTIR